MDPEVQSGLHGIVLVVHPGAEHNKPFRIVKEETSGETHLYVHSVQL